MNQIRVSKSTKDLLDELKYEEKESYDKVINRILFSKLFY